MRITMVGTGYVGLVTGTCFANTGNDVTCLDIDPRKIDMLNQGKSPIYEPGLDEMIKRNVKAGRLHFTTDKAAAYGKAEVIFICVGTPSDEQGRADLKYVLAAARDIGDAIESIPAESDDRRAKIIVVKSTVPVGTNAKVKKEIASRTKKPFRMASNPEFLATPSSSRRARPSTTSTGPTAWSSAATRKARATGCAICTSRSSARATRSS
jgi:UDPglucose 6-dehydrogenase